MYMHVFKCMYITYRKGGRNKKTELLALAAMIYLQPLQYLEQACLILFARNFTNRLELLGDHLSIGNLAMFKFGRLLDVYWMSVIPRDAFGMLVAMPSHVNG